MKPTEYVVKVEEASTIKAVDQRMEEVVNGVYNSILDSDKEIEQLYSQWNDLLKKRREAVASAKEKKDAIFRRLLLNGINPETDKVPEDVQSELNEIDETLGAILEDVSLGIAEVKIALLKKGLDPSRFSPSMRRVKFKFTRL